MAWEVGDGRQGEIMISRVAKSRVLEGEEAAGAGGEGSNKIHRETAGRSLRRKPHLGLYQNASLPLPLGVPLYLPEQELPTCQKWPVQPAPGLRASGQAEVGDSGEEPEELQVEDHEGLPQPQFPCLSNGLGIIDRKVLGAVYVWASYHGTAARDTGVNKPGRHCGPTEEGQ